MSKFKFYVTMNCVSFTVLMLLFTILSVTVGFAAVVPEAVLVLFLMTTCIAVMISFTDRLPMTIKENLTIANLKSIYRFPMIRKKEEEEMFRTYSEQVQVKMASPEGLLTKLSGGNQQKVVVARWLAANCKLLIVDEPTRGIDVLAKNEIHKLMRKCADEGLTILAVSSELEELIKICNRILIMHEGRQKGMVDASEITPEQILHIALT